MFISMCLLSLHRETVFFQSRRQFDIYRLSQSFTNNISATVNTEICSLYIYIGLILFLKLKFRTARRVRLRVIYHYFWRCVTVFFIL